MDKYRHTIENPGNNLSKDTHENKLRWIKNIHMKRLQGIDLSAEDYSFLLTMQYSMGNDEYAKLIQATTEILDIQTDLLSKELDAESYLKMKLGTNQQRINLLRAKNTGAKENAQERKVNLETINRYAKLAK